MENKELINETAEVTEKVVTKTLGGIELTPTNVGYMALGVAGAGLAIVGLTTVVKKVVVAVKDHKANKNEGEKKESKLKKFFTKKKDQAVEVVDAVAKEVK